MKAKDNAATIGGGIKFTSLAAYHAAAPASFRVLLDQLRDIIQAAAPQAIPIISYNMPAFKAKKVLVYYAAYKQHIGFYPTAAPIEAFKADLVGYKTSKGAIQLPLDQPLPVALIQNIVRYRLEADSL